MDMNFYKRALRAILLAAGFALFFFYVFIWILGFPVNNPDKTLAIGRQVTYLLERLTLPIKIARLSWQEPDKEIIMPLYGLRVRDISDSWHAPRPDNRLHEGQDIFAPKGTPVFSGTYGYVTRLTTEGLGGNSVYIIGAGGRRYYYTHLERFPAGLRAGQEVTTDTVIGFVGNSGNAETTPYHLHLGVYVLRKAIDPLPLLVNRP